MLLWLSSSYFCSFSLHFEQWTPSIVIAPVKTPKPPTVFIFLLSIILVIINIIILFDYYCLFWLFEAFSVGGQVLCRGHCVVNVCEWDQMHRLCLCTRAWEWDFFSNVCLRKTSLFFVSLNVCLWSCFPEGLYRSVLCTLRAGCVLINIGTNIVVFHFKVFFRVLCVVFFYWPTCNNDWENLFSDSPVRRHMHLERPCQILLDWAAQQRYLQTPKNCCNICVCYVVVYRFKLRDF